jgi:hypothetical protein
MPLDPKKKKKRRTVWLIVLAILVLPWIFFPKTLYYSINLAIDANREGFFDKQKQHKYSATSMDNLRALFQATQLYYEANEAMPGADYWMDDLSLYVKTADLKKGEAVKKFVNPRMPAGEGVFGYAFNATLGGAWMENIEDPAATPLIFESKDTEWNANGDPKALQPDPELSGGNHAVTVDGNVVLLRDLLKDNGN